MNDPVARLDEFNKLALSILKISLQKALGEAEYLINATPSGERRNTLTDINIHLMAARDKCSGL